MSARIRNIVSVVLLYHIFLTAVLAQSGEGEAIIEETDVFGSGDGEANLKARDVEDTCRPEFARENDHTMCLQDSPKVLHVGVSEQDKKIIIDYHNQVRRNVWPKAADLTAVSWDDELAEVAQKLAKQCKMYHDKNRNIPAWGMQIGQNLAAGYRSWRSAMQGWYDEVQLYTYGKDLGPGSLSDIGHYTQMVFNGTSRVGCGFARCRNTRYGRFYVCNYAKGQTTTIYPYTRSRKSCSSCPNSCNQGLCDCTGPRKVDMCLNRGSLDINTCTCGCTSIYKGATCNQLNCPKQDQWYCGSRFPPDYCKKYINVPEHCPYMCGLCGKPINDGTPSSSEDTKSNSRPAKPKATTTTTTATPVFVSQYNCTFYGSRPSKQECKTFGDGGADRRPCVSQGGPVGCDGCKRFSNLNTEFCPVMCGLCDAPCNGKKCQNGGSLDTTTCKCSCVPPYTGDTCDGVKCPAQDEVQCLFFVEEFCKTYINVPGECPYMCGLCAQ